MVANQTPEQRRINLAKAHVSKAVRSAARKASVLRRDFADGDLWVELASRKGIRLPPWGEPATEKGLRSWLRKAGITGTEYEKVLGCSLVEYIAWNPTWPLRAMAGVALEYVENLNTLVRDGGSYGSVLDSSEPG